MCIPYFAIMLHHLFFSLLFVPTSARPFADVVVAVHMDQMDQQSHVDFKTLRQLLAGAVKLGSGPKDTRMSILGGTSDGRTHLAVSLFNGTSADTIIKADLTKFFTFPQPRQLIDPDTDAIFERVTKSILAGQNSATGDRVEAPNYLLLFIRTTGNDTDKLLTTNLQKGADAVIVSHAGVYKYGDWSNTDVVNSANVAAVSNKSVASLLLAFAQCQHDITLTPCRPVAPKRCRCVRKIDVRVRKATNPKFCPTSVSNAPCDDADCPPIPVEMGPMPKWMIVLIIWVVLLVLPWIYWPLCCCAVYCMIQHYMGVLMQMALDQGEKIVKEKMESGKSSEDSDEE